MFRLDSREQSPELKAAADEIALLRYDGENGEVFSYDHEIHCDSGQVLCYERKKLADLVGSFDKLERQLGPCDGLIVEGEWRSLELSPRTEDPRYRTLIESTKKRLWRLSHVKPVIYTRNTAETLAFLRYVEGRKEPIEVMGEIP